MMDSDVWKLYQELLNKKYENVDDYLTSYPEEKVSKVPYYKPKASDLHITIDGMEVTDFTEDMDYGL